MCLDNFYGNVEDDWGNTREDDNLDVTIYHFTMTIVQQCNFKFKIEPFINTHVADILPIWKCILYVSQMCGGDGYRQKYTFHIFAGE